MSGNPLQLSQSQKRRMESMSMNMGMRIICGYLLSAVFIAICLYLALTYRAGGDMRNFWCYLVLAGVCLSLDTLVTVNLARTILRSKQRRGEKK